MDPQRAYDVLSVAATRSVPLSTGRVCFFELTDSHSAEVRAGKSRTESLSLAKKYLKACEALEELEKGLETSPQPARLYRAPQVYNNKCPAQSPDPRSCAIVPFVKTAPVRHPLTSTKDEPIVSPMPSNVLDRAATCFSSCLKTRIFQHYCFACKFAFQVLVYVPIFVLMAFCVFCVLASLYLAFHPAVFAKLTLQSILRLVHAGMEHAAAEINLGQAVTDSWIPTWF